MRQKNACRLPVSGVDWSVTVVVSWLVDIDYNERALSKQKPSKRELEQEEEIANNVPAAEEQVFDIIAE